MFDHRADAGIADQGRAEAPSRSARRRARSTQPQRHRRVEQPPAPLGGRPAAAPARATLCGPSQQLEQPQPDAGEQNLRIDEAGTEVEQRAGAPPRDRPRQRKGGGRALYSWLAGSNRAAPAAGPPASSAMRRVRPARRGRFGAAALGGSPATPRRGARPCRAAN